MPTRVTPDTMDTVQVDFDDEGVMFAASENGVATTIERGLEVWVENQDKNIAISRLTAANISMTLPTIWERKNDMVNIVVPNNKKIQARNLCAGLAVTING